jgi:quinol---cytochrome c reductase iron-sulfur subunit, bacillus type
VEPRSGDERAQLPPPSLWPVGFALGVVCLLVGVVVSWIVAGVGAGIAVVFGFLWIRDVMAGQRARMVAEAPPPQERPTAPPIPAHEGEAAMPKPSPEEIERFPRNKFLEGATLGIGALIGGVVTVPVAGLTVVPTLVKQGRKEVDVGPLSDYPEGQWVIATFLIKPEEGEVSRRTAYIRNNGLLDGTPSLTIVSNRCVHLGCPVQPNGLVQDSQAKTARGKNGEDLRVVPVVGLSGFGCPCHGGQYDTEGNRTAGPPVRAMDRYTFSVRNGRLFLGGTFSVGRVDGAGADAKLKRYNLADPGQHIDGIESWLYPFQAPHG